MFVCSRPNRDPTAFRNTTVEDQYCRRVGDLSLDDPLQRTSTERRVVALASELGHGCVVDVESNPLRIKALAEQFELDFDDGVQVLF